MFGIYTDFIPIAQYKVHDAGSIQSMKDYLADFHKIRTYSFVFELPKQPKLQRGRLQLNHQTEKTKNVLHQELSDIAQQLRERIERHRRKDDQG